MELKIKSNQNQDYDNLSKQLINHNKSSSSNSKIKEEKARIEVGENNPKILNNLIYSNNKIITTKYNLLTWAPKSLIIQFRRAANIYFLIVSILTSMEFSPKQPGSMIGTFCLVLVATMLKEGIEDYNRYKQDKQSNNRLVNKLIKGNWTKVLCWTLKPGDIIKVVKEEEFSADTLIIKSNNDTGYCYIDTKNLDGETNLKEKCSLEDFKQINDEIINDLQFYVDSELPNENLTSWKANVYYENKDIFCNLANLILKGCVLKNTKYIVGLIIYSGKNTKIMKNSKAPRMKMSKVLVTMNRLLYSVFLFDIALCLTFAILSTNWTNKYLFTYSYIFNNTIHDFNNDLLNIVINFFTFFVAYSHMIPISLYVALEIVKIIQGLLIYYDNEIYDFLIDKPASCRSTDLVEELGQVEFIFSDKTGTLTQNSMILKKVYINGKVYGTFQDELPETPNSINGDMRIYYRLKNESQNIDIDSDKNMISDFFYLLTLCHACFPELGKDNKIIYQGASPDDIALVKGAQQMGFEYIEKEFSEITIKNHIFNHLKKFELKVEFPFDSDRKRMSVIVQDKSTKQYLLLSKGADTAMLSRMILDYVELDEINRVVKVLSKEGLRVLVIGHRVLTEREYNRWFKDYSDARNNGKDLNKLYETMECSLNFLGLTAIEDKLQDGVPDTIYTLLTCDIRVWVLTGDKQDTAEEIAKSCKLINENMFILYLLNDEVSAKEKLNINIEKYGLKHEGHQTDEVLDLEYITKKIRKKEGKDLSIIVDGVTLEVILSDEELSYSFFKISIAAKSVVCCRVSPKQKSKVVQLVKKYGKWITLSIGDGANDVPMIMEAHIGVGIQGKEGTQAVRSADFSIGQFRFLEKLLLIYGRVGYMKISKFICYYFYKNIILVFTDIFFAFSNGFSGQIYFADYLSTLYNAFFTSWPCLFTFSFERDLDLSIIKKFPILYVAGQKNYYFNLKVFWGYILYAIFHGFICFYIPTMGLINSNDASGITFNHWYKSTTSFSLIIEIVTLKLMVISDFWNGLNIFATFFSILFYYLIVIILCFRPISFLFQNELSGLIFNLISYPKFWLVIIIGPFLALIPDITMKQIFYSVYPNPTEYIKQYLNDPLFLNMVFNDENQSIILNSQSAKQAEKNLQEILKQARSQKLKKKVVERNSLENSEMPLNDIIINNIFNDKTGRGLLKNQTVKTMRVNKKSQNIEENLKYQEYNSDGNANSHTNDINEDIKNRTSDLIKNESLNNINLKNDDTDDKIEESKFRSSLILNKNHSLNNKNLINDLNFNEVEEENKETEEIRMVLRSKTTEILDKLKHNYEKNNTVKNYENESFNSSESSGGSDSQEDENENKEDKKEVYSMNQNENNMIREQENLNDNLLESKESINKSDGVEKKLNFSKQNSSSFLRDDARIKRKKQKK